MSRRLLLWGFRPADEIRDGLGTLERQVLEAVSRRESASVRDVRAALGEAVAYTTVMTVLDRLYKKGVLDRRREGRAYVYSAAVSAPEIHSSLALGLLRKILGAGREAAAPVLSNLVDEVGERDRRLLDDLDRLVREKRRALGRKR